MIQVENVETYGWEPAIRGMRNPMNSWDKMDSTFNQQLYWDEDNTMKFLEETVILGQNDYKLMSTLAKLGPVHGKYRRMITVYMDITAPLYWWKEFDTYKVGTVANSCSTMHKIHAKAFEPSDFSFEHLKPIGYDALITTIRVLNVYRDSYIKSQNKDDWWQLIQLLPSSYNQKRTVMMNYEVLSNIYESRKNHKLDEWVDFCRAVEELLPYPELITGDYNEQT